MDVEVFDLTAAVRNGERDADFCTRLARCLHETSCLIVRDPRVSVHDNDRFLDLMERYFTQPMSKKIQHAHPELRYQVGWMPGGIEKPESLRDAKKLDSLRHLAAEHQPRFPDGPDPKCRFMWRIGPRPEKTNFYELNAEPVLPEDFDEWEKVMNNWGKKLLNTIVVVCKLLRHHHPTLQGVAMCALDGVFSVGLGWEDEEELTKRMSYGPHVLAPTGIDVSQHRELNTCVAGFHTDLNLLTAHGKSRFPGLYIWLRNGTRIPVKIPDGCLLIQSGMQLERLTGADHRYTRHCKRCPSA